MKGIGKEKLKVLYAPNQLKDKEFIDKFDKYGKEVINYLINLPYERLLFEIHVFYLWTEEENYLLNACISPYSSETRVNSF